MKPFLYTLAFCCAIVSTVEAQSIFINVGGGFSMMNPQRNYAFTYTIDQWTSGGRFDEMSGQRVDIGFHIASSLQFQLREAPLSFTAGVSYAQFYGKSDFVKSESPPWYSTIYTVGKLTTRSNILTLRTGAQWQFSRSPIAPYVSLDLLYNIIGDTKLSISSGPSTIEAVANGNTRMGISPGAGARVAILPSMDIVLGANYSWMNLVTPGTDEESRGALSLTACISYRIF